jgi:predicted dehydrogenase
MLADGGVDAVYLGVPHDLHYEMILDAVRDGIPVFTEKPVVRTLAEGLALLPQLGDIKVGVNYQYRYSVGAYGLARLVQTGQLGKVHTMRINVPWRRTQKYFNHAPWHASIARAGGGTLITQASHILDLALWALGEPAVSAMGYSASPGFDVEVETLMHGIVQTTGGTLISITSSMVAAIEQPVSLEVYGERATATYTQRTWRSLVTSGPRVKIECPPIFGVHAFQRSLAAFVRWVRKDIPYLTPAQSALPVLAAVEALYRSAESGQREVVEPVSFQKTD